MTMMVGRSAPTPSRVSRGLPEPFPALLLVITLAFAAVGIHALSSHMAKSFAEVSSASPGTGAPDTSQDVRYVALSATSGNAARRPASSGKLDVPCILSRSLPWHSAWLE